LEVAHDAQFAPETAGQLVHAAEPVAVLYEPAAQAEHGPPFAPV
jgi:hypothetical protein